MTIYLVHLDCDIESSVHEEMSSAWSNSAQIAKGLASRNKQLGIQDIELQERKRKIADFQGLESSLSDRNQLDLSFLGLPPCKTLVWYGRRQRKTLASIMGDGKPATLMKDEDKQRNREVVQSLKNLFEVVAVEQDERARLKDDSHGFDPVPKSNMAGSNSRE